MFKLDKKKPVNTGAQSIKDIAKFCRKSMDIGTSNAIEQQESEGQESLVNSDTLPTNMTRGEGYDPKAILEASGVKFLNVVENDELFRYVELPPGWKKAATLHDMWSDLLDDKGRVRARIFYKAAFYDRNARLTLTTRFSITTDYERANSEKVSVTNVMDGERIIHSTTPIPLPDERGASYEIQKKSTQDAAEWLKRKYPNFEDPGAYWD